MPINSRNKGKSGEAEVIKIIHGELGIKCCRNLDQVRNGGHDILGLDGWAIEVKRAKKPLLAQWWTQTVEQAEQGGLHPVLWYKLDYQKWRVVVPLNRICDGLDYSGGLEYTAEMSPQGFACLYREKYLID